MYTLKNQSGFRECMQTTSSLVVQTVPAWPEPERQRERETESAFKHLVWHLEWVSVDNWLPCRETPQQVQGDGRGRGGRWRPGAPRPYPAKRPATCNPLPLLGTPPRARSHAHHHHLRSRLRTRPSVFPNRQLCVLFATIVSGLS